MTKTNGKREVGRLADLRPDPNNARRHTERNLEAIERAIEEVGAARSIVIDETGTILAGNATVEAATRVGLSKLRIVDSDGDEVVAVRRAGLTESEKTRLALYDNRAAEHAEWDRSVLAGLRADGTLKGLFYEHELADLFGEGLGAPVDPAQLWQGMPDYVNGDAAPWRTLHVHFAGQEDYDAFSRLIDQTLTPQTRYVWFPPQAKVSFRECADEE